MQACASQHSYYHVHEAEIEMDGPVIAVMVDRVSEAGNEMIRYLDAACSVSCSLDSGLLDLIVDMHALLSLGLLLYPQPTQLVQ